MMVFSTCLKTNCFHILASRTQNPSDITASVWQASLTEQRSTLVKSLDPNLSMIPPPWVSFPWANNTEISLRKNEHFVK